MSAGRRTLVAGRSDLATLPARAPDEGPRVSWPSMTERGPAPVDRATACPFVAFDDDRDARAERPDHRHRCYAERRPAPRAIAHQESYCLSAGFPTCPTFQDWARREAAHVEAGRAAPADEGSARDGGDRDGDGIQAGSAAAAAGIAAASLSDDPRRDPQPRDDGREGEGRDPEPRDDGRDVGGRDPDRPMEPWATDDERIFRHRPGSRDWAAPPPWAPANRPPDSAGLSTSRWLNDGRQEPAAAAEDEGEDPHARTPAFLSQRSGREDEDASAGSEELAAVVARSRTPARRQPQPARSTPARSDADHGRDGRPIVGQALPGKREEDDGTPSWERPRRFEAYPTLKTRVSLPRGVSRVMIGAIALAVAAVLVFLVPTLFFGGGGQSGRSTHSQPAPRPQPRRRRRPRSRPTRSRLAIRSRGSRRGTA